MNSVILLGRLTKDPDVRYTNTGKCVTGFSLAVDRPFTNANGEREADFINCQIWGKSAEQLGNSVHKGQRVLVEGRLQIRQYEDKQGAKRYATEVVCNRFEYIERKADVAQGGQQGGFDNSMGEQVPFNEEIPF